MLASGKKMSLDEDGDEQDGDAEIADDVIDPVDREEQRLGDEVEAAPVDQMVEAVELERVVVAVDERDFLGAGEQARARGGASRRARRCDGLEKIIGLIGLERAELAGLETRADLGVGSGISVAAQYLSVMPSQPFVFWKSIDFFFSTSAYFSSCSPVAQHADEAFVT